MNALETLEYQLAALATTAKEARKEHRQGLREGRADLLDGCDCGRGSSRWLNHSQYWRDGYEAGWKAAAQEDR